jgi:hypothetical protein
VPLNPPVVHWDLTSNFTESIAASYLYWNVASCSFDCYLGTLEARKPGKQVQSCDVGTRWVVGRMTRVASRHTQT